MRELLRLCWKRGGEMYGCLCDLLELFEASAEDVDSGGAVLGEAFGHHGADAFGKESVNWPNLERRVVVEVGIDCCT